MKRKLIAAFFVAGTIVGAAATDVGAAPITCPDDQVATKTDSGWDCKNKGDQFSGAEDPKNPNADKHKF